MTAPDYHVQVIKHRQKKHSLLVTCKATGNVAEHKSLPHALLILRRMAQRGLKGLHSRMAPVEVLAGT
jgi:hypothetical protein